MAVTTALHLLFLFFILFVSTSISDAKLRVKPHAFHLSVRKDKATLQYYVNLDMGDPVARNPYVNFFDLVIDLGGRFLWFNCSGYDSTTYHPVRCGSKRCKIAKGTHCLNCNGPIKPGCTNNTCGVEPNNPIQQFVVSGDLAEDVICVSETDGFSSLSDIDVPDIDVPHFLLGCVDPNKFGVTGLLDGLANGTRGIVGFGRTQIAFQTQLVSAFKLPNKFALCLPSSTETGFGDIFVGGGPYFMPPHEEYFIGVKSIKIDGKAISLNSSLLSFDKHGNGGTRLSTVTPYTVLHTSIFKALVDEFVKKAEAKKIKRVKPLGQFGACFDPRNIANTITGPAVPKIDLVFQNERTHYRIYGANSMVKVKNNVICLAFVDGGSEPKSSIVIGGHQLEDTLVEFDLASSQFGFTPSLLLHNVSCSHFRVF
ncbi:basic 7S globulin-like [Quillaja saponaria]|uniref:Basic 7S globulin-like n=1 Tax=Quillaja saponaria TaxID=32244 RepID=A0AAD7PHF6_QUISA|nr:basic 7S globulin-like [Quillaja saponaria]